MNYSQLAHEPTRPRQLAHGPTRPRQLAHANSPTGQVAQGLTNSICKAFTKSIVFSICKYNYHNSTDSTLCLFRGLAYKMYQLAHSGH